MTRKMKLALSFILALAFVTGYCLWQIDRHEKALLGQEWLNPVPYFEWQKYLKSKNDYEQIVEMYVNNNPNLIALIENYQEHEQYNPFDQSKQKSLAEIFESLPPAPGHIGIPDKFYIAKTKQTIFAKENPSEFTTWQAIVKDIYAHAYVTPTPANPPKQVIQQEITAYYRYMTAGDSILLVALAVFLFSYKEKPNCNASDR